jgi:hypothetical protein
MAQKVFAFGDNSIDGQPCPVLASSHSIDGHALTVAEHYDDEVSARVDVQEGTIPASVAEKMWEQALSAVANNARYFEKEDPEHADYLYRALEAGKEVRDEIF